jgi:Immunoglobulin-like domain of bacterial spore germination
VARERARLAAVTHGLPVALAVAAASLTAVHTRIGAHPATVRVVVDFAGGALRAGDIEATDPDPADGTARVRLRHRGVRASAAPARAAGVRATVTGARNRLDVAARASAGRFKYLRVSVLHAPERLVLDLYRSRPPVAGAEIPVGARGCLAIASVAAGRHAFTLRGRERDLFEHAFVLRVRNRAGRVVGRKAMTAGGAWRARIGYRVATSQPGTLEAVADSAKDGSLACLAQVHVTLAP